VTPVLAEAVELFALAAGVAWADEQFRAADRGRAERLLDLVVKGVRREETYRGQRLGVDGVQQALQHEPEWRLESSRRRLPPRSGRTPHAPPRWSRTRRRCRDASRPPDAWTFAT
jgi:hypothetical protein